VGSVYHVDVSRAVRMASGSIRRNCRAGGVVGRSDSAQLRLRRRQCCGLVVRRRGAVHFRLARACGALVAMLCRDAAYLLFARADIQVLFSGADS